MPLTKSQKKYISKNKKNESISDIAKSINSTDEEVKIYLKKTLPRDKYDKLLEKEIDQLSNGSNVEHRLAHVKESVSEVILAANDPLEKYLKNIKAYFIVVFLILLGFIPYLNSLPNAFVSDDIPTIKNVPPYLPNPWLRMSYLYISIRVIINSAIYYIFNLNPAMYRLPNLVFHALNCGVLYLIFLRFVPRRIALIAAALFALHPIQAEAITWISGAPYSQSAFFMLLAFYFYLKIREKFNKWQYALFIVSFVCGLYSDAKSVVVIAAFILYEILFGKIKKNFWYFIPHILVGLYVNSLSYFDLKSRISTLASQYQIQSGLDNPLIQIPISLSGYFQLYAWPQFLSLYQTEITIMGKPEFVLRCIVTVAFFVIMGWSFFKSKKIFFWLFFFLVALAPYLTPFRISWYVAERYAYISTAAVSFLFGYGVWFLLKKLKGLELSIYFTVLVILLALGTRTVIRNFDWYDEDTLWFATYATSPSGYQIHNNMGDVYTRRNDFVKAAQFFENATKLKPDYAAAYHNLGITQLRLNKQDEALANFQKAVSINPEIWQSQLNIGAIYYQKGDTTNAQKYVENAYKIMPNEVSIKVSLATIYLRQNRINESKKIFLEVLSVEPNNPTAKQGLSAIEGIQAGKNN